MFIDAYEPGVSLHKWHVTSKKKKVPGKPSNIQFL